MSCTPTPASNPAQQSLRKRVAALITMLGALGLIALAVASITPADAQPALAPLPASALPDPSRGELLYTTHCISCHTDEMHLRAKSLVNDRIGLLVQVRRWQGNAALNWNDEDVLAVAGYLDARYYHLAPAN